MASEFLEVEDLRVAYGRGRRAVEVLKGVSLTLDAGMTLGLVGESGSGKSTLGRAILGLAPATAGRILFEGQDIAHATPVQRRLLARYIQVIFQDPYTSLNPSMKVRDILAEPLIAQGRGAREVTAELGRLLDRVAMPSDSLDRYSREFSGGQRQRIAIARALALSPRLIVCDEPVSALDLSTQRRVLDLLQELQTHSGLSYLFISHDLAVVRHISHTVAVMFQGEIVEFGGTQQVIGNPSHMYTRRLLASSLIPNPEAQALRRARRQQSIDVMKMKASS